MSTRVRSIIENGGEGLIVDVECHVSRGLPGMIIVGLAARAIDEARERIRSAFSSSAISMPRQRITLSLAPGDIPKDSTSFDLPMAAAIMASQSQVLAQAPLLTDYLIIGELALDGSVRPVRGIIGKLIAGQQLGHRQFVIPKANLAQARLVPHLSLVALDNVRQLVDISTAAHPLTLFDTDMPAGHLPHTNKPQRSVGRAAPRSPDISDVVGQESAKRALLIAAAGGHNLFLSGPPGTGKSMLARLLAGLLPPPQQHEVLAITHLHSLASKRFGDIASERPFRAPHHSISHSALVGGGSPPRPGEISLAHHGVLFLDEMPEFSKNALEALRQPLEDHTITITRAQGTTTFPAQFILVASANPCPCGYYGTHKECHCRPHDRARYTKKLSGPLLDRIDLFVSVENVPHDSLLQPTAVSAPQSLDFQRQVAAARERQLRRSRRFNMAPLNSLISHTDIKQHTPLTSEATTLLNSAAHTYNVSPRHYMRTIRVARTIADLDDCATIDLPHIAEALQYRHRAA